MDHTHSKLIPLRTLGARGSSTLTLPERMDTDVCAPREVSAQLFDGSTAPPGSGIVAAPLPVAAADGATGA